MRSPWTELCDASIHRSIAMLAAASRRVVRRAAANKYNIPQALLERAPSNASSKDKHGNDWDGWRWEGYASGWIYDGRKGFPEHQPGFLTSRARCLCTAAANVNIRELPVMRLPTRSSQSSCDAAIIEASGTRSGRGLARQHPRRPMRSPKASAAKSRCSPTARP